MATAPAAFKTVEVAEKKGLRDRSGSLSLIYRD